MTAALIVATAVCGCLLGIALIAYRRATRSLGSLAMHVGRRSPLTVDEICSIVEQQLHHKQPVYLVDRSVEITVVARPGGGWWLTIGAHSSSHDTIPSVIATLTGLLGFVHLSHRNAGGSS